MTRRPPVRSPSRTGGLGVLRSRLVRRHDVRLDRIDPQSPLQVGNGSLAMGLDVTGLQTVPEAYPVAPSGTLLGTQAVWGWHSTPTQAAYSLDAAYRAYATPYGIAPYLDLAHGEHDGAGQSAAETWLRANPHRLDLGRVGLWPGHPVGPGDIRDVDQHLDLWAGTVHSRFTLAGTRYSVTTAAHPQRDAIGIAAAIDDPVERCGIRLRFAYGSEAWGDAADWSRPGAHTTDVCCEGGVWRIRRKLDDCTYWVTVAGDGLALDMLGSHDLVLHGAGGLAVIVEFSAAPPTTAPPAAREVIKASARHWERFWLDGAAVELAGSDDPRAAELERRVLLSEYLTAVNGAGPLPPAETGLLTNSWRGKFHLEMHWFHAAHFALWGRPDVLARQLDWYHAILPIARETAHRQGLPGARWPKQVDPSGRDTPSSIGPFLVWQQPHPIYLAELLYRLAPEPATVDRWVDLVVETAELMAAFAASGPNGYELGPPIVPAQESYHVTRRTARNPTFELAYWSWALGVAIEWCERAGRPVPPRWRAVSGGMARPHVIDGIYAGLATPPYLVRGDHPSMLAALGLLPQTAIIDPDVMARTFDDVWADWDWDSTWGWDCPVAAMTATRLGRPADAVDALLRETAKNTYLANGHNRQSAELPAYLPGNGALLSAVALMVAGWDDAPVGTPGFPDGWRVAFEGLSPLP